jgi:hypothetical protein
MSAVGHASGIEVPRASDSGLKMVLWVIRMGPPLILRSMPRRSRPAARSRIVRPGVVTGMASFVVVRPSRSRARCRRMPGPTRAPSGAGARHVDPPGGRGP